MIAVDISRVFTLVLAKSLSIQKFILGKVCLKAVVKVALSLQRLASARQVKISNHTMIVPSQIATEEEATQYAEQIAVKEEEESEDMLLSRFADETDLPDWYFIWFLRFDSFCFYQCVYFCKRATENSKQFVSKEVMLDSICHRF